MKLEQLIDEDQCLRKEQWRLLEKLERAEDEGITNA